MVFLMKLRPHLKWDEIRLVEWFSGITRYLVETEHYENALGILNFSAETKKHVFTIYLIFPYWYDTDIWNPFS